MMNANNLTKGIMGHCALIGAFFQNRQPVFGGAGLIWLDELLATLLFLIGLTIFWLNRGAFLLGFERLEMFCSRSWRRAFLIALPVAILFALLLRADKMPSSSLCAFLLYYAVCILLVATPALKSRNLDD